MVGGRLWAWLSIFCAHGATVACGGDSEEPGGAAGTGSPSGGAAGAPGGAGGAAAGGTAGAASGAGGVAGSLAGGGGAPGCSGAFGPPTGVLGIPDTELGGLTLSSDELEMIYGAGPTTADSPRGFFRSVRGSTAEAFPPGTSLPELDAVCATTDLRSGDLSSDGLRFYFVCYPSFETPAVPLRVARRAAPGMPFVVDTQTYGNVSTGPSISADELTLYTTGLQTIDSISVPPVVHTRASVDAPFGEGTPLSALGPLLTPDVSEDGLGLFGARSFDATTGAPTPELLVAERAGVADPFGMPVPIFTRATAGAVGSAAISANCRSLYYVDVASDMGVAVFTAMVLRR